MVEDEAGNPRTWEVSPIGHPVLLSEQEAQLWKPLEWEHWADHLPPAPGQI